MKCVKCGSALEKRLADIPGEIKGEKFVVKMEGLGCTSCDFATVRGTDMPEFMRRLADEYRSHHDLLTSSQIRERRTALGMTQAEFAEYLGVGIASVKRWELGQIQDASMNRLLVLLTDEQQALVNFRFIQQRRGKQQAPVVRLNAGGECVLTAASQRRPALSGWEMVHQWGDSWSEETRIWGTGAPVYHFPPVVDTVYVGVWQEDIKRQLELKLRERQSGKATVPIEGLLGELTT